MKDLKRKLALSKLNIVRGKLSNWLEKSHLPPRMLFVIAGIISTVWFLTRVIPKPSRAAYPCVRVAAPVMSGFVLYLLSLSGIFVVLPRLWKKLLHAKYLAAVSLFVFAAFFIVINLTSELSVSSAQGTNFSGPIEGPNIPSGIGRGINPGYVVWAWNPDATNENCRNVIDNGDWYFRPKNTNQKVAGKMFSESIINLCGKPDLKESWDGLFRYHNLQKNSKNKGYTPGEKIFIKINQGTASWILTKEEKSNRYALSDSMTKSMTRRLIHRGATETAPYIVLELLRELVDVAGVRESDIYIGDPIAHIFDHNYSVWHSAFPDINYIDRFSEAFDRTLVTTAEQDLIFYSDKILSDKLYDVIESADYLINVASLKPHGSAGISLTSKNHFGSHGRPSASHLHYSLVAPLWEASPREPGNASNGGYNKYRVMVDIMGSKYLGQNTMLFIVDGLFGGGSDETKGPVKYFMAPFNNDWSNSVFLSQDQVALESVCLDFLRGEWDGINIHDKANNIYEEAPNMFGVDDYLHQAADSKNWPENIHYDPDNSGKPLTSLGVHEHWNNPMDKQYSGNMGMQNGITLVSIPDTLVN
jgi:Domain of unknown function (DUF362)